MKAFVTANLTSNLLSRKNLLLALRNNGWEVLLSGCDDGAATELAELGFSFHALPMQNKGTDLRADFRTLLAFHRMYREERPDAVLHFNSKPDIYGSMAASLLGIPAISNITGLGMVYVGSPSPMRTLVNCLYRIAFAGNRNKVVFQNENDRSLFLSLKIVSEKKTVRVPGSGVDISAYKPRDAQFHSNGADGRVRFLFASRLVLSKGIREFIHAAGIVQKNTPNTIFDVVGEMLDFKSFIPREELNAAIASGVINYHGNARNMRDWIEGSDCIVLPSYYREGIPRILLEGAAMGKPLIAADSIGTREPVIDGKNGFLCKPGSAEDLADKIQRFIGLDEAHKSRMSAESRRIAEEQFSDEIVTKAYLDALPKGTGR